MEGDVGTDTATYASRTAPLTVTIDGIANDGATAEGDDNVKTDVENLVGGSAKDSLTGSGGAERDPRRRGQRHHRRRAG